MRKNRSIRRGAFLTVCLLLSVHLVAWAQSLRVAGSVTDKNGDPLPGVSIVVKGTTTGTITMGDGSYQIEVPSSSSTLVYSFIGFQSQEVMVGGQSNISVTLQDESIGLSDVVVVGYGTQRKESVTGSVASLKGEVVRDVPSANISRALQGRVAGVEMSQTSSKPGAEMQICIRGTRSLNASNDPLIVLDGIPFAGSIGDINPGDIKSIDILKDASATAIYGSRGANGVILVSTNKGTKGQEAKFSYNGYYGLKDIFAKYPMMNGSEFVALRATGTYQNTLDESNDVNTDWQDLLYKTGMVTSHDIGVNGGTEKGSYSFGAGYYRDEAVVPLQDYSRYSMRASLDQEIGQYFKVGFTSTNNYSVNNGNNLGAVYTALARSPIANPYNADGSLKEIIQEQSSGAQWVSTRERLESLDDKYIDQTRSFGSYNTMYGEVKIPGVEGLKYRINVGLNYRQSNSGSYTGEGVFSGNPKNLSTASIANSHRTNWAVENLLTYDRLFADKHQVNAVAMYSAEETQYNRSSISVKDIPSDAFQFYNLGRANGDITLDPSRQEYEVSGLLSWMGRVMYSFDSRYMVSVTCVLMVLLVWPMAKSGIPILRFLPVGTLKTKHLCKM